KNGLHSVTVKVLMEKTTDDTNFIVYSISRPLQVSDFAAQPDELSLATAITNSGMLVTYDAETKNGYTDVFVHITPYFDKTKSWYRNKKQNPKTLLHEQKHFDIAALKACELVNTIRNYTFTAD